MYIAGRWADRQLSRLELVIAVIILSLVLFFFLQYMLKMFAVAERSFLTTTVININTAMHYRAASYIIRGDTSIVEEMMGINPFTMVSVDPIWFDPASESTLAEKFVAGALVVRAPRNYLGELDNPDPAEIDGGHWYFNSADNSLVYRVNNAAFFFTSLPGPPRVIFLVDIEYVDRNSNDRFDPDIDEYRSIGLKAINDYEWYL